MKNLLYLHCNVVLIKPLISLTNTVCPFSHVDRESKFDIILKYQLLFLEKQEYGHRKHP